MLLWLWLRLVGCVPLITKFGRATDSKNTSETFKHDLILTQKEKKNPLQVKNKLTDAVLCLIFRIYSAEVLLSHRGGTTGSLRKVVAPLQQPELLLQWDACMWKMSRCECNCGACQCPTCGVHVSQ